MRRFAGSKHRVFDTIPVAAGGAQVPDQYTYAHPGERIAHDAMGCSRLAREILGCQDLDEAKRRADKIILGLFDIPSDAAAMKLALERKDEEIRGILESNYRMAREITELRGMVSTELHSESPALDVPMTREPHRAASGE